MKDLIPTKATCPNCWHEFFGENALHISQHSDLIGDDVLGEYAAKRYTPFEVKVNSDGVALDPKGWEMLERACPKCHLQIPVDLLDDRPKFISIVGAPRSGKTYFLNVMLHHLRKSLARKFSFAMDICDSHDKELFSKHEQRLFFADNPKELVMLDKTDEGGNELYNSVTLDGVQVQLPKPFTFTLRSIHGATSGSNPQKQTSIALYDNAGEQFFFGRANDGQDRSTRHLGESDAVLFAYDPLLDPEAKSRLRAISKDPQLFQKKKPARQQEILTAVVHRMRKHSRTPEHKKLKATLAICVQKYDVWKPLLEHCKTRDGVNIIDHTSIEYFKEHGVAALDTQEINIISYLVGELISDLSPEFAAIAEANFQKVRYFPVSALGQSPVQDGDFLKIAPINIQPFRAEHPMLWLLWHWKLIGQTRYKSENPKNHPMASVEPLGKDKIRVTCPESNRNIILDHEYAFSDFYDSDARSYCWIPESPNNFANESRIDSAERESPKENNTADIKLTLKTKKKSGWSWFKKKD